MIPRYALLLSFLFSFYGSNAQTKTIEQLKHNIQSAQTPGETMKAVLDLCDQGYSLHPDTLMLYAQKAQKIAVEQNNVHDIARAMYYQSFALTNKGLIDSSLKIANQCLQLLSPKLNDGVLLANVLNQKGRCFMRKNQYKEAIDMGYQVIVQQWCYRHHTFFSIAQWVGHLLKNRQLKKIWQSANRILLWSIA